MKSTCPDLETLVSFIIKRVSNSNEYDWKKLKRGLTLVKNTINYKRVLGERSLSGVFMWIDVAYAVHGNMRIHTCGAIPMGYSIIHVNDSKHKINVKSSTETELVGVSEYIPYNLWLKMFLEEQIYIITDNMIFQDNKIVILVETNGSNLCTGNLQHINVFYLFIKDRV